MLQINPGRGINLSNNPKVYEKEAYCKEYRSLNKEMKTHLKFENQGILLQLISRFLEANYFKSGHNNSIPSKILDNMNYIQLNLSGDLAVEQLAA
ncbi:hypothetical protein [Flavobacterium sp. 1]|uniref:hypothetical protein n=1 Tax=Flavobacterium sp. 1 TaxID=2035200 RepID=UPI000C24D048|nr:hypothetical protein [Flavobacterium sp. 1]